MEITLVDESETELFGAELWRMLPKKCLVFLNGELGAGKTTLTRAVLRAAGYKTAVKSPTYTLVEEYELASGMFFHFDLYRLKDPVELEWIGVRDYLEQQSLCFIEWPDMGKGFLPEPDISITLETEGDGRKVILSILSNKLKNKLKLYWKNKDILL
jgi:tRNA threonylcarbamoyladenosine biosynthesis protein TsaE